MKHLLVEHLGGVERGDGEDGGVGHHHDGLDDAQGAVHAEVHVPLGGDGRVSELSAGPPRHPVGHQHGAARVQRLEE